MSSASEQVSHRYQVNLPESWREWFDGFAEQLRIPGMMRQAISVEELCQDAPKAVWPGFMLPDTLPLVGNEYGDWICVRITPEDEFGELIYWYHGGGDWVPLGTSLAAAFLHDGLDLFRPQRKQMLRSASESRIDDQAGVFLRLTNREFVDWAGPRLNEQDPKEGRRQLKKALSLLSDGNYLGTLKKMYQQNWARDAVACDWLELDLHEPIRHIASQDVAKRASIHWFPDFVRLLFDTGTASTATRERVLEAYHASQRDGGSPLSTLESWPEQNWERAHRVAEDVLSRRRDLGWATAIAGWGRERSGDVDEAIHIYFQGRKASSFSDQSVRFNTHAFSEDIGKFSASRLTSLRQNWPSELHENQYLSLFAVPQKRSLLVEVSEYWKKLANESEAKGHFVKAYEQYYASGWDLGVSRLSEYSDILAALARCAKAAGWTSRSQVAETHLACLTR